jgi:hypothetical protein
MDQNTAPENTHLLILISSPCLILPPTKTMLIYIQMRQIFPNKATPLPFHKKLIAILYEVGLREKG